MHKTHPSSKKLKDFFKSSIKNESRLYFDCTAVRSRTTFIILVCCRATSGHPIPHAGMLIGQKMRGALSPKKKSYFHNIYFGLEGGECVR